MRLHETALHEIVSHEIVSNEIAPILARDDDLNF